LLAFSRIQPLTPTSLDPNLLVTGMSEILRRTLGSNIELITRLSPNPCPIKADQNELENVILNLAVNARDAMPDGGRLVLETRWLKREDGPRILTSSTAPESPAPHGWVELTVADTGLGMDEATRQRIFEPFFTTKSQDTGPSLGTRAGLGLASVYGIIEQSGGCISVRSAPGDGSIFRIVLPAAKATAELAATESKPFRPGGGSEIILVTEDEETVRIFTCEALRAFGYVVLEATDGVDAMEVCRQHDGPIDLLLTDVVMPRMGGQELAEKFVEARPQTRVIFMSGYTGSTSDRRGNLDVEIPFLAKPFHLDALSRLVRQELDRKKAS
jgi:CheY-like chemotaxis protein